MDLPIPSAWIFTVFFGAMTGCMPLWRGVRRNRVVVMTLARQRHTHAHPRLGVSRYQASLCKRHVPISAPRAEPPPDILAAPSTHVPNFQAPLADHARRADTQYPEDRIDKQTIVHRRTSKAGGCILWTDNHGPWHMHHRLQCGMFRDRHRRENQPAPEHQRGRPPATAQAGAIS